MLDKLFSLFTHDIGIDLGTANTLIYVKGRGILVREPSVVAIHKKTKEILAVGSEAKRMLGKTPALISAVRPLRDGVISDFYAAQKMIEYFIKTVHETPSSFPKIPRPRIVLGVPSGITSVERKAVLDAALNAGAREAFLVEEPMAAAIGAGLPVWEAKGTVVVDMGGGTTEIAVISLGGMVISKSIKTAGDEMDVDIVNYARNKHNMLLGEKTAEEIKIAIGSVADFEKEHEFKATLRGRDLKTGLPKSIEVSADEIRESMKMSTQIIVNAIKDVLEGVPAEIMPDIVKNGITLAGGTSLLRGMQKLLNYELKVPVVSASEPLTCVVRGCGKLLDDISLLHKVKIS